jgi:two-component system, OmpR family, response regulator
MLILRYSAGIATASFSLHQPTTMSRKIAIVEDDANIRANYVEALKRFGFEVDAFSDRQSASNAFAMRLPDLAIIDIGLGNETEGGFVLCKELRSHSATLPIIFLSARDSDIDIVSGFRLGADDYLTKDVSLPHLMARINALFRRSDLVGQPAENAETMERGALLLDLSRMQAKWKGDVVALTVTEFWMVHTLVKFPGHVKSREHLMSDAEIVVDDTTITSHVKRMRKKFIEVDANFDAIDTVYGMGYRWKL